MDENTNNNDVVSFNTIPNNNQVYQQSQSNQNLNNQFNQNININQQVFNPRPVVNNNKNKRKKYILLVVIIITIIALLLFGSFYFLNKQNNNNLPPETEINISNQLYSDYLNENITTDEYVRYLLYTQYDTSMLDEKYQNLLKSDDTINIEELINKYYEDLSTETLNYFAKKINLNNITFEVEKENEETTEDNKIALADLFIQTVYAKSDKVTNLNKAVLSKNGNFVVWYTTTGNSATNNESAVKIADGLENTISKYDSLFKSNYSYKSNVISKGTTYKNQQKILENSNIDPNYLESAMQIYLVNYNDSSTAQYISGYGKGKEILNSVFGGDSYGTIAYPYIVIKPSSFNDFERLEQLYNHEIFHHYQRSVLCGNNECNMSSDPYYSDSTANWASALSTNKTTTSGFLNEWAQVYRYNSNSLLGRYVNQYGEAKAAYAMFVYLFNYSNIVDNGTQKIIEAMYKSNFLEYLEDNSTLEERKNIQKEIALKNLTFNYNNNNLNIPTESRAMSNINDTINIKKNDVYMEDVGIGKMGLTYFAINLTSEEAIKITIDKDNNYIDAILVAQNENDDYIIVDSSDSKGNQIIFDTNNYNDYRKFYLITYNNNITLQNYYSLTIKQVQKNFKQESSSNKNFISYDDCNGTSDEVSLKIDTYYLNNEGIAYKAVITLFLTEEADYNDWYEGTKTRKNFTNVKLKGNVLQYEYTDEWFKEQHDYFNTKDRLNYFYGSSCDLGCSGDSCQWGSSDGQTIDFDPESIK